MKMLWTVESKNALKGAKLCEYSDEDTAKILDSANEYAIKYSWSEEKDNWDDDRGSGSCGGIGYFAVSEKHVLVCGGKAIGVVFKLKNEGYGRFSGHYFGGLHFILFGDNKVLDFGSSYYVGSTDVTEKNDISLVKRENIAGNNISNGRFYFTGLDTNY